MLETRWRIRCRQVVKVQMASPAFFFSRKQHPCAVSGYCQGRLEPVPELDDIQWHALKKSLAFSRIPRFSSCAEFIAALGGTEVPQPEVEEVDETGTVETLVPKSSRRLWP